MRTLFAAILAIATLSTPAAALAEKDSAQCLSDCTKKYEACRKSGTAEFKCLEQRARCIESCA